MGYNLAVMLVSDIGEFGVIERLNRLVVHRGVGNAAVQMLPLQVDTGDDTAAWTSGQGHELFTTDTMVEGIHFLRETTPWRDLGWKAVAANISDVASMGGLPTYALITLGLPPDTSVDHLEDMYRGMLDIGEEYGMAIVGGDIVGSPVFFVTTALAGQTQHAPLLRSHARPGDAVAVSGYVGSSAGGLKLMLESPEAKGEAAEFLRDAHRRPRPHVRQGEFLASAGITCAMDISDGLADDLGKLCFASGVAARLWGPKVPAHRLLQRQFPGDYLDLALGGGEDYVLLFAGEKALVESLLHDLGEGSAVIGIVEAADTADAVGRVIVEDGVGSEMPLTHRGWDHLQAAATV